jgi:hypothetical protein
MGLRPRLKVQDFHVMGRPHRFYAAIATWISDRCGCHADNGIRQIARSFIHSTTGNQLRKWSKPCLSRGATGRIGSTSKVVRSLGPITCSKVSISGLTANQSADRFSSSMRASHPGDNTHYVNANDMLSLSPPAGAA